MATEPAASSPPGRAAPVVEVWHGIDRVEAAAEAIDELHDACRTPITSRRTWALAWYRAFDDHQPLVIAVRGPRGRLDGLALLARRRRTGREVVVAAGHGTGGYASFAARDPDAARALGQGVRDALDHLPGRWALRVELLFAGDPGTEAVHRLLPHAVLAPAGTAHSVRLGADRTPGSVLGKSYRRDLRKKRNRMAREGRELQVEVVTAADEVASLLPVVDRIHRMRDDDAGRVNRLADARFRAFFDRNVLDHAAAGALEVHLVRIDGTIVAYDLAFVEPHARRLWNGRFDPAHAHVSPGKLSMAAVLEAALADPHCEEFDLMVGDADYKRWFAPEELPLVVLHAASTWPLRARATVPGRLKEHLAPLRRYPAVTRTWRWIKARRRAATT